MAAIVRNNIVVVKDNTIDTTGMEPAYMKQMSCNVTQILVKILKVNYKKKEFKGTLPAN
jgi:hypothetical protein